MKNKPITTVVPRTFSRRWQRTRAAKAVAQGGKWVDTMVEGRSDGQGRDHLARSRCCTWEPTDLRPHTTLQRLVVRRCPLSGAQFGADIDWCGSNRADWLPDRSGLERSPKLSRIEADFRTAEVGHFQPIPACPAICADNG